MELAITGFIYGLIQGLSIAILAIAFSSVYMPTGVFHLAIGAVYAIVPFIAYQCLIWGFEWYFAIAISIAAGVCISIACEIINHTPLTRRNASQGAHLISSLGLYILIVQLISLIWGNETKVLDQGVDVTFIIGDITLTQTQIISAIISVFIIAIFFIMIRRSKLGLLMRGMADNSTEFVLRGYSSNRIRLWAFGISGFLCAIATLPVAYDIGFSPQIGLPAVMLAIVAVIIGGNRSFIGPVIGGIILGVIRSETVCLFSERWKEPITYCILAIFLFIRPFGIVGAKIRLEENK
jgi:branched-chain amino acid transport system permease protein